jgi:hypothetical protein
MLVYDPLPHTNLTKTLCDKDGKELKKTYKKTAEAVVSKTIPTISLHAIKQN